MPMWTVIVKPGEREHVVRADALEVSAGALIFRTGGAVARVYAPNGYEWARLEEE
jgi:hypothetical protein